MVILYSNFITPRLKYITDFFAELLFTTSIELTTDKEKYINADGIRLNYSNEPVAQVEVQIIPHSLLEEKGIHEREVPVAHLTKIPVLFPTNGDLPFDIFSASFFLLSRYEEYLPWPQNAAGVFPHESSIAHKHNFIGIPLINLWLEILVKRIEEKFQVNSVRKVHDFQNVLTYDIDIAFAYKHKPLGILAGGLLRSLILGRFKEARKRVLTASGLTPDPYQSFSWLKDLHTEVQKTPTLFFLLARQYRGVDRNNSRQSAAIRQIIAEAKLWSTVAIHPSWKSVENPDLFKDEKNLLEEILKQQVFISRQHYLRFELPKTYRQLIEAGIREDYSMGYGYVNGYRASTSSPFRWYDLDREQTTDLIIYPLPYMDATSLFQSGFSAEQAFDEVLNLQSKSKILNSSFVSCWHNSVLSMDIDGLPWREMHEKYVRASS